MSDSGGIKGFSVGFGRTDQREVAQRGPFHVVVVSPLAPVPDHAAGATPRPEPRPIDKQTFDQAMQDIAPSLWIEITDPFAPGEQPLRVDLSFKELKALRPDAVVEQVPLLRALASARKVVQEVKDRRLSAADARNQLSRILPRPAWAAALTSEVKSTEEVAPPPAPAPTPAEPAPAGGSLFDMVDIGPPPASSAHREEEPGEMPQDLAGIVARVARSVTRRGPPPAVVGTALQKVEQAFSSVLSQVLQHPEVKRIEEAWRGLKLFVDQCDFRAGVQVDVVPAHASEVEEALLGMAEKLDPERGPVDLILVDQRVRNVTVDLDRLSRWGEIAEQYRAPIVVEGDASLLGADSLEALGKTMRRLSSQDDARTAQVRALAGKESSRWIAVALNGVLVRAPYTPQSSRIKDPPYQEDEAGHVFVTPVYVVGAVAARSYVQSGWPTAITGARDGGLGNLVVREIDQGGQKLALPLETFVTQDAHTEITRAGFLMLTCAPNSDTAIVARAPMIYRGSTVGARQDEPATTNLGDQLFVGRLANALEQLASAIPEGTDPRAVTETAHVVIADLFSNAAPPGPEIKATVDKGQLVLTVRPRRFAGVGLEEITLGAKLG